MSKFERKLRSLATSKEHTEINGIYHCPDRKAAVATNGHVLMLDKSLYNPKKSGEIELSKEKRPFPDYQAAFPKGKPKKQWTLSIPVMPNNRKSDDDKVYRIQEKDSKNAYLVELAGDERKIAFSTFYGKVLWYAPGEWACKWYGHFHPMVLDNDQGIEILLMPMRMVGKEYC